MYKIKNHQPPQNCSKCERLYKFRNLIKNENPNWHNNPVNSFGSINSKILIVGLAPGKKGANRTGRPFTGDGAGNTLFNALLKYKLASGYYEINGNDNLKLNNCRITNIVKCVPPKNRPTKEEFENCKEYLRDELLMMPNLKKILALGRNAFNSILNHYNLSITKNKFKHQISLLLPDNKILLGSYHCSRYNTNTKRLTINMFNNIINELVI